MSDEKRQVMAPIVLAGLGMLLGWAQWMPPDARSPSLATKNEAAAVAVSPAPAVQPKSDKGVVMASDEEISAAEADLQAAKDELQSKLTRSLPGGVQIAKPEVGQELKRLREDVEAKQRRLDSLRKD